jgi:hypothetical protein
MKPADFIVRIPEPCHEDWNQMQPDAKGKFCSSCSKSVFDFSNKTDAEIKTILIEHKDQKVCGHFKKTQIDRPLNITLDLNKLPKNISLTKTFAIALFLVFGSLLFSCKDEKGNEVPVKIESPQMAVGMIMSDLPPPPLADSSSCHMLTGEVPIDNQETVYVTEGTVDGGISFEHIPPEPIDPPKIVEHVAGGLSYMVFEPDPVKDTLPADSTFNESKRSITDQSKINPEKVFSVYPNPSSGEFTVAYDLLKRSDVNISIYNISGSLVRSVTDVKGQYEGRYRLPVNLNELPNGIYIVTLINGDKKSTERLVIAR